MPETVISIIANIAGKPDVAVMALLGSNVVDMTFVFGMVAIFAHGIKVKSEVMRKDVLYLVLLCLPLLLGIDGTISRTEGVVLLLSGLLFFYTLSIERNMFHGIERKNIGSAVRTGIFLAVSLAVMIYAAHHTIRFLSIVALDIGMPEIIVALIVIATGTCLPELLFTIQSVRSGHDGLALGDILGVVIIDATIVLGVMTIISPITVDVTFMRVLGLFNALAACMLIYFIKARSMLRRTEGIFLLCLYVAFVAIEFKLFYS